MTSALVHHKDFWLPGGSAVGSDAIYQEVVKVQQAGKPVVVSMGNLAASGGYYISGWLLPLPHMFRADSATWVEPATDLAYCLTKVRAGYAV